MTIPSLLIESWLPIEAIGAESMRERGASSALPPLYFLHVWWARRPLTVSRAAILAGVLPDWSAGWPEPLRDRFPDRETYQRWFFQLIGLKPDVMEGRKALDKARAQGRSIANPYSGPRAFTVNPSADDLSLMGDLLEYTWGTRDLTVLDPFAGGGSIPFEALRYGFTTIANDLNPVAAVILKATLDYPARFGPALADDIREWGKRWYELVKPKLRPYFTPLPPGADGAAYLWARTVACPTTGKPVPLSPNWWLSRGDKPVAVQLVAEPHMDAPRFRILKGKAAEAANPDEGTISRGVGRSPWTGETISGDTIKAEAQAGRMGQMLYAVAVKRPGGFDFRAPTEEDLAAVAAAEEELARKRPEWILQDLIPTEPFPGGNDNRPLMYGMPNWADLFLNRQLLAMGVFVEALKQLGLDTSNEGSDPDKRTAILAYLGIVLSKCVDYNCKQTFWDPIRGIRHTFSRHDFAFRWNPAEFDASANLLPWAVEQVATAYKDLANLTSPAQQSIIQAHFDANVKNRLRVTQGSASNLEHNSTASIANITVDPPYYDNVQYAELADFFYVWLKRSVGHLFPEFFTDELTNKDDEAVANPARFESIGRKKKDLAEQDYENKMAAAFREMHRVLRPDGALTVMFTHKKVEAWDTLAGALIGAGFAIHASWPVHTESEHSLHQAKKNAAASTILLVCRKRRAGEQGRKGAGEKESAPAPLHPGSPTPVWWDDIKDRVRRVAREKAQEYLAAGISGVDLTIATFGPTLAVISEQWPVLTSEIDPRTGEPMPLRPETALDLAREEVARLRKEGLLAGRAIEFDPFTDWYLLAWDIFRAEEFPYDEARKLAIALGVEMDDVMKRKRLAIKKGQSVVLQQPQQRRKKGMVDPDVALFEHHIDALHTAMLIYQEDGAGACDVFLQNRGLKRDTTFRAGLQALINAIPRAKAKGAFVRPEADVLDRMRLAFYADELTVPVEEEVEEVVGEQMGLFGGLGEEEEEDEG